MPVARHPGDADDLARVDLEIEVPQGGFGALRRCAHPAKLERRPKALVGRRAIADFEAGKLLPKHEVDQAGFVGLRLQQRPGDAPLAQDGDAVGALQHFAQLVRDQDDGKAVGPQVLEDFQQSLDLVRRQDARGLIQDQQACVRHEQFQDLDFLLFADRELRHARVGRDGQRVAGGNLLDPPADLLKREDRLEIAQE